MEGDVSSLIGFLSGKGTSLNVSIKLPEKNTELKLEGEVESHSLPSMSGLRLRGEGEDLSVLLAYLPNMPSVKSNGFKFNTVVKSKDNNYFVNFENFLIHCQSNTVNFSGSLSKDNNNIAYELKVSAKGNELDALKSCSQDIAENEVFNLINDNLEIDFFQFEGEVTGNNKQVKLTDMKIDAQSQLDIMSIELNASDIASLSKVSAKVLLSGKNVENLVRRVSYWYQPDFTVPETDSYRAEFKFFLDKDVKAVEVYEANVELTKDEQMIKLQQADQSMARVDSWAFDLDAKGDDLAHWYPEFEEFHTPELLAFDFKGQVFLDQGVWGFRKSDIQLSKDENHLQLKGDVSYEQTIQQLALEFAFEGQEHDFLSMVSHETDSLDVASKVDTRLSGKLSGDSDNFSLKDFSYEGKRGELKGNIDISLGDRKKINADLGDVHLIVNLDKDENAEKTDWKEETISLDWMDNLDLKLAYEHFKLTLNDADFDLGASEIFMEDGKLDWKAISLAYLETEVLGSLFIDARQDSYHLSIDANNLDFGSLLKELGWFNDLQGRGRFLFSLEASGKTMVSLFSNMKGVGKFYLSDGKVKDFGNTSTNYIRATMPWRKNLNDLEIDCFMSRLFIEDEKLRTRKLYFSNRNMYVMGGGTLDLSTYKLDMAFSPRAHSASFLDANVSLFVQGAVDNPQVKVDKLSAVSDVGIKYGQWALLGPLALAIPKLPLNKPPTCREALDALAAE